MRVLHQKIDPFCYIIVEDALGISSGHQGPEALTIEQRVSEASTVE